MWFGIYYVGHHGLTSTCREFGKSGYYYSKWWTLRCWPVLKEGKTVPTWYMAIWDYFGYAKDYEEGID